MNSSSKLRQPSLYLEFKTIGLSKRAGRKPCSLRQALRHNRRVGSENWSAVDSARTPFNTCLFGPTDVEVAVSRADERLRNVAGRKLRRDYVQAVELVTSLPSDAEIDSEAYFRIFLDWARNEFGPENLISADVHRDQAANHCHLLVLPITDGRYSGSNTVSGPRFTRLRKSFTERVGEPFGLHFAVRITAANKRAAVQLALDTLSKKSDPVLRSQILKPVEQAIRANPRPFLMELGLSVPSPAVRMRSMAEIFTSCGKGPASESDK